MKIDRTLTQPTEGQRFHSIFQPPIHVVARAPESDRRFALRLSMNVQWGRHLTAPFLPVVQPQMPEVVQL